MQREGPPQIGPRPEKTRLPLLVLAVGIGLLAVLAISHRLAGGGEIHPLWLIGAAALIAIALPMLRANFFPSAKDCATEYDFHEKRLHEHIRQQISHKLGAEVTGQLYSETGDPRDSLIDHCRELLLKNPARNDPELRFALLLLMARVHENTGDYQESVHHLKRATDLKPNHFIANFRIAMNYEWIGDDQAALRHYQRALGDSGGLSRAMEKLTVAQIQRIQHHD